MARPSVRNGAQIEVNGGEVSAFMQPGGGLVAEVEGLIGEPVWADEEPH